MAADFAFETDAAGRLVFVAPDDALGWQAGCLLGQPARLLLASPDYAFDPFAASPAYRDRRTWLRRADGTPVCLRVTAAPVDGPGSIPRLTGGMRGVAWDMSEAGVQEASTVAALRRVAILDQILDQMRQEVCGPQMILTVIEGLAAASGAMGAVVVDLLARPDGTVVMHQCGLDPATILPALVAQADQEETGPGPAAGPDGQRLLICTTDTRHGQRIGLCLWRAADAPEWSMDDTALLSSVGAVLRLMLEHTAIQRESLLQCRSDPLTGLLNRRTFLEEAGRRIDRLDRGGLPGTLMLVDLDNFQSLNDRHGHEMGDDALCFAAVLLRNLVRPADLIARVGGDEFALWMDEFDDLTAAERAERLRLTAPGQLCGHSAGGRTAYIRLDRDCLPGSDGAGNPGGGDDPGRAGIGRRETERQGPMADGARTGVVLAKASQTHSKTVFSVAVVDDNLPSKNGGRIGWPIGNTRCESAVKPLRQSHA